MSDKTKRNDIPLISTAEQLRSRYNLDKLKDTLSYNTVAEGKITLKDGSVKVLDISGGGTGADNAADARVNLGVTYADMGIVPLTSGGTGKNTLTSGSYLAGNGNEAVQEKTPAQVLEDIGAMGKPVLLWQNANISSSFSPQMISLNLSSYTYVIVCANEYWAEDRAMATLLVKIKDGNTGGMITGYEKNYRYFSVSVNGAYFAEGHNSAGTENNSYTIPTQIWGIKL